MSLRRRASQRSGLSVTSVRPFNVIVRIHEPRAQSGKHEPSRSSTRGHRARYSLETSSMGYRCQFGCINFTSSTATHDCGICANIRDPCTLIRAVSNSKAYMYRFVNCLPCGSATLSKDEALLLTKLDRLKLLAARPSGTRTCSSRDGGFAPARAAPCRWTER